LVGRGTSAIFLVRKTRYRKNELGVERRRKLQLWNTKNIKTKKKKGTGKSPDLLKLSLSPTIVKKNLLKDESISKEGKLERAAKRRQGRGGGKSGTCAAKVLREPTTKKIKKYLYKQSQSPV